MSDFVSPETAIKMRDAGFPQPDFKFGQLWTTKDGRSWAFVGSKNFESIRAHSWGHCLVFVPTVTDIMRELPQGLPLQYQDARFIIAGHKHNIAAEAAALAWLETLTLKLLNHARG